MKISHEVPRCLLATSPEFNDYDYCLPHLMDEDEEYRQYFYDAKAKGRYIVMDNSLHELGHAYDHDRLFYWMNEIKPNEFIVPDVWMDKTATLVNAKYWKQYKYPKETTAVAVVQAKSYGEAVECYTILRDLKYRKIAFSYGADWYADLINIPNKTLAKSIGRIYTISKMYEDKIITSKDRVHLLGCSTPQEFGWYGSFPFIESIDTSNPVMAALEGIRYTEQGLTIKPTANMNTHFNIDFKDVNYEDVIYNTKMFRKINGFKLK